MTSKRLGVVIAAAFVLWSLTTIGFAPTPIDWADDVVLVGTAYAGDPDQYEDGNSSSEEGSAVEGGNDPAPPSDEREESGRDDVTQTITSIVSLLLWGISGTTL
jgi:hypothetical protein